MLGPWTRLALVPTILPALDGVIGKLEAGATVADVGCGAGVALTAMAQQFPGSRFHGYDISRYAIERATERVAEAGLDNVELHLAGADALPAEPTFDLVLTFDCLHDMTDPRTTMAAIRRSIEPDGTWLVKDIRCAARPAGQPQEPDGRDDVRVLDLQLHVVGPVRARRGRARHARAAPRAARRAHRRRRLHPVPPFSTSTNRPTSTTRCAPDRADSSREPHEHLLDLVEGVALGLGLLRDGRRSRSDRRSPAGSPPVREPGWPRRSG